MGTVALTKENLGKAWKKVGLNIYTEVTRTKGKCDEKFKMVREKQKKKEQECFGKK